MMVVIPTEIIVACGEDKSVCSSQRIRIRVLDHGGGPYLAVEGFDEEPNDELEMNPHCFYLQSKLEIDKFAAICKKMLREAEKAEKAGNEK